MLQSRSSGVNGLELPCGVVFDVLQVLVLVKDSQSAPRVGTSGVNEVAIPIADALALLAGHLTPSRSSRHLSTAPLLCRPAILPGLAVIIVECTQRLVLSEEAIAPWLARTMPCGATLVVYDDVLRDQPRHHRPPVHKSWYSDPREVQEGWRDVYVCGYLVENKACTDAWPASQQGHTDVRFIWMLLRGSHSPLALFVTVVRAEEDEGGLEKTMLAELLHERIDHVVD
mmetsp:Transcript_71465/g.197335  ORF Transcript_71465/g.197335 Transcript_71465/m.197335 type:complete len:228 (-) Transcript_71465:1272-1955(-)